MTDLERAVATAVRLSDSAARRLLPEIQRNIDVAKAELKRSGVSATVVDACGALVTDAIITFCQAKMDDESDYELYMNAFMYQQDNLRKS